MDAHGLVVGAGPAGLVATAELVDAWRRVLVVDQEPAVNLGGQAHWGFGDLGGNHDLVRQSWPARLGNRLRQAGAPWT